MPLCPIKISSQTDITPTAVIIMVFSLRAYLPGRTDEIMPENIESIIEKKGTF